jgi:hypothetical protein
VSKTSIKYCGADILNQILVDEMNDIPDFFLVVRISAEDLSDESEP